MQHHKSRPPSSKDPRINRQITNPKVRLVVDGKGTEVVETKLAIEQAEAKGLDLVEVSPDQDPPVCKIVDFGKWKFEQQKRKKEQAKNQHVIQIKEIKLRPKVGINDYKIKKDQAISFLENGDKVKVTLRFRGREIAHPDLGMAIVNRLIKDVTDVALVETPAKMEGKQIVLVLAAKPGQKKKTDTKPKPVATEVRTEKPDAQAQKV
ncbi:MAG: translation initiation factor IF-3 [Spirochaetia bacterium]|nr:translation initiation factor IF-3 [Spirochaetia bacterium]